MGTEESSLQKGWRKSKQGFSSQSAQTVRENIL